MSFKMKPHGAFMRGAKDKLPPMMPKEDEMPAKMSKGGEVCKSCGADIEKWADGGEVGGEENERIRVYGDEDDTEAKRALFKKMMAKGGK